MAKRLSDLKADLALMSDGRWVDYEDGTRLKIASIQNRDYQRASAEALEAWLEEHPGKELTDDVRRSILIGPIAKCILRDWDGFLGDDDASLPYTPELGAQVLADPAYRDLYDFIDRQCALRRHYRMKRKEADQGN